MNDYTRSQLEDLLAVTSTSLDVDIALVVTARVAMAKVARPLAEMLAVLGKEGCEELGIDAGYDLYLAVDKLACALEVGA